MPFRTLALLLGGAAAAVAAYCLTYTALTGNPESIGQALGWALANVCPWIAGIEFAKRASNWIGAAAVMAAALAVSLAGGWILDPGRDGILFELWRRVPALAGASALVALLRSPIGRGVAANDDQLALLPRQIDWVRAAGNYVELRGSGRTLVHRASLGSVEQQLADHGFVRIHRSMLVRRDCIARIRPEDVVLADGTHLKIGKRYRAALAA